MLATKIGLVILSEAKDLCADRDRPFAEFTLSGANVLRVTGLDLAGGTELDLAVDEELSRSFEPALIN